MIKTKSDRHDKSQVTIIVVVTEDRGFDSIFHLLHSFLPQEGDIDIEFIVVDELNKEREKIFREEFPWVKLLQVQKLMSVPYMRNVALQHARGEIIAFADDHVLFHRKYIENLITAFSKGYRIVGGPVLNANPETMASWLQYFCEYHHFLLTRKDGEVQDLPGCNFAYRADLLKELGGFQEGSFGVETFLHKKARQKGNKLYFCHGLEIAHINDNRTRFFWKRRFRYGLLFASRRGFPTIRRVVYGLLSPLIAVKEYILIFSHVRGDQNFLMKFIQCTPLLVPTLFIWAAGECAGYLFGTRR
jgi:GT2 family glycosyltransferase